MAVGRDLLDSDHATTHHAAVCEECVINKTLAYCSALRSACVWCTCIYVYILYKKIKGGGERKESHVTQRTTSGVWRSTCVAYMPTGPAHPDQQLQLALRKMRDMNGSLEELDTQKGASPSPTTTTTAGSTGNLKLFWTTEGSGLCGSTHNAIIRRTNYRGLLRSIVSQTDT